MAELVNLRTARKRAKRREDDKAASVNRAAHGRPATERKREAAQRELDDRALDRHRIEPGGEQ